MAKSIRSKWKRKCRAVKRQRYAVKELDRLKKTLGIENDNDVKDVQMSDLSEIGNVITIEDITDKNNGQDTQSATKDFEAPPPANPKKLRNKNGAYPIWLHPRKRAKKQKKKQKSKK